MPMFPPSQVGFMSHLERFIHSHTAVFAALYQSPRLAKWIDLYHLLRVIGFHFVF